MANYVNLQWKDPSIVRRMKTKLKDLASADLFEGMGEDGFFDVNVPITEEITLEARSSFTDALGKSGLSGQISGFIQSLLDLSSTFGGSVSRTNNLFNLQVWDQTEPLAIPLTLFFYTKSNPLKDVLMPVLSLASTTVLRENKNGSAYTSPGYNVSLLESANETQAEGGSSRTTATENEAGSNANSIPGNGLINVRIPGVVKIERCFTRSAAPTFSKEVTESGMPLWAKLDIELSSALPASDFMLTDELIEQVLRNKQKNNNVLNQIRNVGGGFAERETPLGKITTPFR